MSKGTGTGDSVGLERWVGGESAVRKNIRCGEGEAARGWEGGREQIAEGHGCFAGERNSSTRRKKDSDRKTTPSCGGRNDYQSVKDSYREAGPHMLQGSPGSEHPSNGDSQPGCSLNFRVRCPERSQTATRRFMNVCEAPGRV